MMEVRELKPEDLSLTRELAFGFFRESALPGTLKFDHWCEKWAMMIERGIGIIIGYFQDRELIAMIGAIAAECTMTKDMEAVEAFWYCNPAKRGSTAGIRLLQALEHISRRRGIVRLKMMHLSNLNPEKMEDMYRRMGYTPLERAYYKNI